MKTFLSPKVKLKKSKIGKGLFAVKNITKGEVVIDYSTGTGKMISERESNILLKKGKDYMIQIDDDLFFAATNKKSLRIQIFLTIHVTPPVA